MIGGWIAVTFDVTPKCNLCNRCVWSCFVFLRGCLCLFCVFEGLFGGWFLFLWFVGVFCVFLVVFLGFVFCSYVYEISVLYRVFCMIYVSFNVTLIKFKCVSWNNISVLYRKSHIFSEKNNTSESNIFYKISVTKKTPLIRETIVKEQ